MGSLHGRLLVDARRSIGLDAAAARRTSPKTS